jgi:predicted amidophosphoribosyltransferase
VSPGSALDYSFAKRKTLLAGVEINPRHLRGPWTDGYALDIHTRSSTYLGVDQWGHDRFDTTRSPVGQLLYELKYRGDQSGIEPLAEAAAGFVKPIWAVDAIVPVPPSNLRKSQPVMAVANAIAARLGVPICADCLTKVKQTPQLKDITDYDKRREVLSGAFIVNPELTAGANLLLFDDLHGSGATVAHIVEVLSNPGRARAVYLLTLTTK